MKVRTQGRVYTVTSAKNRRGTTKTIFAESLVVFTGDALNLFKPHPILTLAGFKRICGQWISREMGDVEWEARDAVVHGRVIVVSKVRIIPIADQRRRCNQKLRVWSFCVVDVVFGSSALLLCILALTDWLGAYFNFISDSVIHYVLRFLELILAFISPFLLISLRKSPIKPKNGWDVEAELKAANIPF